MIVTAPGRQGAAAPELTAALADATSLPVRVLTAESEGRLAYDGAVARARREPARDRRRRRCRRRLDGGRRRHAVPRRCLGSVGRRRLAAAHPRSSHRRSAVSRSDQSRRGCRRPRALGHEPAEAVARARGRRQRPRADEDRRPPLRRGRPRSRRQDPLAASGGEGGTARSASRRSAPRPCSPVRCCLPARAACSEPASSSERGGLREGAALELAAGARRDPRGLAARTASSPTAPRRRRCSRSARRGCRAPAAARPRPRRRDRRREPCGGGGRSRRRCAR